MKLKPQILKLAHQAVHDHLLSDLYYSIELHNFLKGKTDSETYLSAKFGFKKFLYDYGVSRTLKAGDIPKLEILKLIYNFKFGTSHVDAINVLAEQIQQKELSSNSGKNGPGLPRSFCSKLLYVLKPDQLIPYDSYVLTSLQVRCGHSLKTLDHYYEKANEFRLRHFSETGPLIKQLSSKVDLQFHSALSKLNLNPDRALSWKLTDKYLLIEHEIRRTGSEK